MRTRRVFSSYTRASKSALVRLAAGPSADQLGILDRLDDAGRIRVLLSMFGQQVPVSLSRAHVLPVG